MKQKIEQLANKHACEMWPDPSLTRQREYAIHSFYKGFLTGSSFEKRYFVRIAYDLNFKNKLDKKIRNEFRSLISTIVLESEIPMFRELHKTIQEKYIAERGRCKLFEFRDSSSFFSPTTSRTNFQIYITDGFWLDLIEIKETIKIEKP